MKCRLDKSIMSGRSGRALASAAKGWAHGRSCWGWRFSPPRGSSFSQTLYASAHSFPEPSAAERSPRTDPLSARPPYCSCATEKNKALLSTRTTKGTRTSVCLCVSKWWMDVPVPSVGKPFLAAAAWHYGVWAPPPSSSPPSSAGSPPAPPVSERFKVRAVF